MTPLNCDRPSVPSLQRDGLSETPEVKQLCRLGEELCEAARGVLDYTLPSVMAQHRLGKAVKAWDEMMGDRFLAAIELSEGSR